MFKEPYIAMIKDWKGYKAYKKLPKTVFLMTGSMLELPERVYELQKHEHDVFLHCDFIQGLNTNTEEALLYIQDVIGAQGIISTKGSTIRNANKIGLKTIQRIFIVDTLSLTKSIENCKTTKPNAVEIMPGIMPSIIKQLVEEIEFPIIAGGLIQTREDAEIAIRAGASAISTSHYEVWIQEEKRSATL
ncbi:glycerol-3-phosphate responsive antiterminator [Bacillus cereus group sp. MYBKT14-1]|uniref:glycerol-3-phosphate responsive antiterminator n=1 Tax=Bacillus TaxID=1386 RepID=UPI0002D21F06|nr:glycerol-3-phosphate responsive antiterminator [Bacillus sp. GeD10]HEF1854169.1 glycerol-3-phosphate responsive antiterminator [Bacillus cereus]CCW07514.1 Glycerol uptake operon antiterminator regulatory protein [Bacillus sp. GeD10]HEF1866528.1 glycerol-3-phosphate responsive antiterminator [Bacillus cereus]HEF1877095.1 glycerol-3-phosphate responsive antiterminator [Bacillus cereus]HEF1883130.1 glycerol-3-phosphate responsive antiterminator [Bacillus cereus]